MEDGSVDQLKTLFLCSYSLRVLWVVLQVRSLFIDGFPSFSFLVNAQTSPTSPSRSLSPFLLSPLQRHIPNPCSSFLITDSVSALQVSLAVLLDNFVSSSARLKAHEAQQKIAEKKALRQFKNPLEPLVARQDEETKSCYCFETVEFTRHTRTNAIFRHFLK
jgi:hypothetical protein